LTWEGVPHALRSIGALPFLAVLVGSAIDAIDKAIPEMRAALPWAVATTAIAFFAVFSWNFFTRYPERAFSAFDGPIAQRLTRGETVDAAYPLLARRYYELRSGALHCAPTGGVTSP